MNCELLWQHYIACVCNDNPTRVHLKINFTLLEAVCARFFPSSSLIFIFAKICSCCATHCCHSQKQQKKNCEFVFAIIFYNLQLQHIIAILLSYFHFSPNVWQENVSRLKMSFGCMATACSSIKVNSHFALQTKRRKNAPGVRYQWIDQRNYKRSIRAYFFGNFLE